ncbi:GTP cyclohydrolase 1 feedback regulatory protein isoform X1 [Agelaius phoeniceus]|uniref:GTP cyclohydrolase 1 feedback regulatory protein isoform X1 n=1 Tax=Agelaius phoeniceus TaxID=39638 RepID=UPI004054CBC4
MDEVQEGIHGLLALEGTAWSSRAQSALRDFGSSALYQRGKANISSVKPGIELRLEPSREAGPTMVGDEHSDPHLMSILGATKRSTLGNNFCEYYVNDAPRVVLDKLESLGYRVVSMTGVGQTLVWCLHRE